MRLPDHQETLPHHRAELEISGLLDLMCQEEKISTAPGNQKKNPFLTPLSNVLKTLPRKYTWHYLKMLEIFAKGLSEEKE